MLPQNRIAQFLAIFLLGFSISAFAVLTEFVTGVSAVGASAEAQTAAAQEPRLLELGNAIEAELRAGEKQSFRISLTTLDFARVEVTARNVDLSIKLIAPDGRTVADYQWNQDSPDPANVSLIAGFAGSYRIELTSREKAAEAKSFSIKLAELRAIEKLDPERIEAERQFAKGEQFRASEASQDRRPALPNYQQALEFYRAASNRDGEANALHALGRVHDNLNLGDKALEFFNQALVIRRETKNRSGEAAALVSIASIYNNRGERQKAMETYQQALAIRQELKDRRGEASTLQSLGLVYRGLNQRAKALEFFEKALAIRRELKDRRGEAGSLAEIGAMSRQMGQFDRAFESYNLALPIFQSLEDKRGEAVTLNSIGVLFLSQGKRKDAIPYFERALDIQHTLGAKRQEATTLSNMGAAFDEMGERPRALEHYNRALAISREINDQPGVARTLHGIGEVYTSMGENRRAMEYFQQAQPLLRATGGPGGEANVLFSLGKINSEMGNRQLALDYYQQALERWREANFASGQASALASIGLLYNSLGERNLALGYLNQGLEMWRKMKNPLEEANLLTFLGVVSHNLDEREKALDYLEQALKLAKEDRGITAMALNSSAIIHRDMEEYPKALDELGRALPLARAIGDRGLEADTLHNIGWVRRAMKELPAARENLTRSLEMYRGIGNRSSEGATLFALAHVENDAAELNTARTRIEAAIDIAERLRAGLGSTELRASYFASVQKYYDLYIEILMRQHEQQTAQNGRKTPTEIAESGLSAAALKVSERARARGLLDLLTESNANIRQGVDEKLIERERDLQQLLNAKADRQIQLRIANAPKEKLDEIAKELQTLSAEFEQVQTRIRSGSPRYAALTQPQTLNLKEIQSLLDADTMLLEYFLGDDSSYLWAVTPTTLRSYKLPKRADINEAARRVYELLIARNQSEANETDAQQRRRVAQADAEFAAASRNLSRMILSPVAGQLGKKRLVIVAQGALQYVPFGALPLPVTRGLEDRETGRKITTRPVARSPRRPVPLIADHEIINLPSASTLAVLRRETEGRKPAEKMLAVFADPVFDAEDERIPKINIKPDGLDKTGSPDKTKPASDQSTSPQASAEQTRRLKYINEQFGQARIPRLPFTRQEAEQILSLVPEAERKSALDFSANRATVAAADLSQYRIIHFATHGLLNSQQPALSSIVLSLVNEKGQIQEGFLRSHEIYNLNLPAEVVVLSACETGLGKEIKGEGLVGLTRGFMYAGSPRVVVSLWSVNDRATANLMTRFYRKMLKDNLRPAAALRAAQIEMLNNRQWNEPYFWAAFALQGEWR